MQQYIKKQSINCTALSLVSCQTTVRQISDIIRKTFKGFVRIACLDTSIWTSKGEINGNISYKTHISNCVILCICIMLMQLLSNIRFPEVKTFIKVNTTHWGRKTIINKNICLLSIILLLIFICTSSLLSKSNFSNTGSNRQSRISQRVYKPQREVC